MQAKAITDARKQQKADFGVGDEDEAVVSDDEKFTVDEDGTLVRDDGIRKVFIYYLNDFPWWVTEISFLECNI